MKMKRSVFLLIASFLMSLSVLAQDVKNHNMEVAKNLEIFNALYRNLDMMYVDTLDANKVVTAGIDAADVYMVFALTSSQGPDHAAVDHP
jgi:carboxyl-terminal processing protease